MLDKIRDIEIALENKSYLSALALSLTLPDICGEIEYPHFKFDDGKRNVGKQYATWFDNWVNQHYADCTGWTNDYAKAKNPYFTGKMCYSLRCSFLHAGNLDIKEWGKKEDNEYLYSYEFRLGVSGADSFGSSYSNQIQDNSKIKKTETITINIDKLCKYICLSAERYYREKGSNHFKEHNIHLIDFNRRFPQ
ncbi:hypothetical protein ACS94_07865 [Bacillus cereus]|uniref:hypothetical protein n=1 Tax=Bacillus cereus group TaxID=86661 RepID=UPI0007718F50|nr:MULTISPECIES: hypothetical protein [Bacillus cereus group]KXI42229.1 hypothetical protein ACS94_07865 [Bacillus cereus]KZD62741.1 hypothetical protein B4118_3757 [Bacillus cereus]MEB9899427.1 hypothetical protein [Bacillus cereus]MEC0054085.1 hypothetical protein [Bacillus cereus]MEC0218967.1 hypothetical protein [Bacillus cereus]